MSERLSVRIETANHWLRDLVNELTVSPVAETMTETMEISDSDPETSRMTGTGKLQRDIYDDFEQTHISYNDNLMINHNISDEDFNKL